jgi:hypothetical protein
MFTACNDWLNVEPKSEVRTNKMFEEELGFKNALSGIYIKLATNNLYSDNLTMGNIEHLANLWETSPNSIQKYFNNHDYNNYEIKSIVQQIYGDMYNVIANINSILEHIDAKKDIFSKGIYKLIKGEVLALRAYCHFDILRLFGQVPLGATTVITLPYAKKVTKHPHTWYSYNDFVQFIIKDLSEAEKLLKEVDPIVNFKNKYTNLFYNKRKSKMNYYAVLATKARVYLWTQDKKNAYKYSKQLIEAKKKDNDNVFILGDAGALNNNDYLFSKEHIISLDVSHDFKNISDRFSKGFSFLHKEKFIKEKIFNTKKEKFDIRLKFWTVKDRSEKTCWFKKYSKLNEKSAYIPLIRLYEMYLIAIESAPSLSESNRLLKIINDKRKVNYIPFKKEAKVQERIIKEYRKEFYAEGLMFYTYKRLFLKKILGKTKEMKEENYVIPIPVNNQTF